MHRRLAACLACLAIMAAPLAAAASDLTRLSDEARELVDWIRRAGDHEGRPFAVVDKKQAHIYVFDAQARLRGDSAALLGQAIGDHTVPGVGDRAQTGSVPFEERTTPAGRFVSQPGRNVTGEQVVWVDYESAFAIHRLRPGRSLRDREQRLASSRLGDRRASLGCVVVPVAFYQEVVHEVLGAGSAVVYVMPETKSTRELLATLQAS